jgi:hypothetical protein
MHSQLQDIHKDNFEFHHLLAKIASTREGGLKINQQNKLSEIMTPGKLNEETHQRILLRVLIIHSVGGRGFSK